MSWINQGIPTKGWRLRAGPFLLQALAGWLSERHGNSHDQARKRAYNLPMRTISN